MRMLARIVLVGVALPLMAEHQADLDSFEKVWTTVRDKHWQQKPGGLDWDAIHAEFRPRAEKASNIDEMRGLLREMLGRLKQTHFGIIPGSVYSDLEETTHDGVTG